MSAKSISVDTSNICAYYMLVKFGQILHCRTLDIQYLREISTYVPREISRMCRATHARVGSVDIDGGGTVRRPAGHTRSIDDGPPAGTWRHMNQSTCNHLDWSRSASDGRRRDTPWLPAIDRGEDERLISAEIDRSHAYCRVTLMHAFIILRLHACASLTG